MLVALALVLIVPSGPAYAGGSGVTTDTPQVFVVDNDDLPTPPDFIGIQAAIDGAPDGSLLLIRSDETGAQYTPPDDPGVEAGGSAAATGAAYSGFSIFGRDLTLSVIGERPVYVTGGVVIGGVAASQEVVLRGLSFPSPYGFVAQNNAGGVWIEGQSGLVGDPSKDMYPGWSPASAWLYAELCQSLVVVGGRWSGAPDLPTIEVRDSVAEFFGVEASGTDGSGSWWYPTPIPYVAQWFCYTTSNYSPASEGAPAVLVHGNSTARLENCLLEGGDGGDGTLCTGDSGVSSAGQTITLGSAGADGAAALWTELPASSLIIGSQLIGGTGGEGPAFCSQYEVSPFCPQSCCISFIDMPDGVNAEGNGGTGTWSSDSISPPALESRRAQLKEAAVEISVTGLEPQSLGVVVFSVDALLTPYLSSSIWVDPFAFAHLPLTPANGDGRSTTSYSGIVLNEPIGVVLQSGFVSPGGEGVITNPSRLELY